MDKKRFLRIGILQMLLMLMLPRDALALARERTGGVSTEVRWLERDSQKIFGRLLSAGEDGCAAPACYSLSRARKQPQ